MTDPILPLQIWPEGIAQASVPANENALRNEALRRPCLGIEDDVADPVDGDLYIVGSTPTGDFATFTENDLVFARVTDDGTSWHAWAPTDGLRVWMADGSQKFYVGESTNEWQDAGASGGAAADVSYSNTTSGLTATDVQSAIDELASDVAALSGVIDVQSPSNSSGTVTLDFDGNSRYVGAITLGANVTTLAFSNLPGAGKFAEYELHITQDPSTPRTFAIPASHKALGGSDTAISATTSSVTVLTASTVDNGTNWRYAMQESA